MLCVVGILLDLGPMYVYLFLSLFFFFNFLQEANATDPDSTYQAWLNNKKEQAKLERKVRRRMEEEKERAFYVRDRKDCDKAFKE